MKNISDVKERERRIEKNQNFTIEKKRKVKKKKWSETTKNVRNFI